MMKQVGLRVKLLLPIGLFTMLVGIGIVWYVQRLAAEQADQATLDQAKRLADAGAHTIPLVIALGLLLILVSTGFLMERLVFVPLRKMTEASVRIAVGELDQVMDYESDDEIGVLADAFRGLVGFLKETVAHIAESTATLSAASEGLSATSTQLGATAEQTAAQAGVVSAAAEEVSKGVQTVAIGADEMGVSIKEIAKNAHEAARVATAAVRMAEAANATVAKLGANSVEIGNVVKVITSIAEQTNLLALNATIEAARAGEHGKGFAVVATEVGKLAERSQIAAQEISEKIQAIQRETAGAVEAINQIGAVVNQIHDFQNTISTAVEEQTATTNEISRNVAEAARGSVDIAQNITAVAQAAQRTTEGASNTQHSAVDLARMAAELQDLVGRFRYARPPSLTSNANGNGAPKPWRATTGNGRFSPFQGPSTKH
jgi:methyl-accepting chemotaxis protein